MIVPLTCTFTPTETDGAATEATGATAADRVGDEPAGNVDVTVATCTTVLGAFVAGIRAPDGNVTVVVGACAKAAAMNVERMNEVCMMSKRVWLIALSLPYKVSYTSTPCLQGVERSNFAPLLTRPL